MTNLRYWPTSDRAKKKNPYPFREKITIVSNEMESKRISIAAVYKFIVTEQTCCLAWGCKKTKPPQNKNKSLKRDTYSKKLSEILNRSVRQAMVRT